MTSPEPGPLAEEAARLVGAAQEWLHRVVGDPAGSRIATGAPECCWCPLCQLIATLRGERPELVERLADTQVALAGALRALADAAGLGRQANRTGGGEHAAATGGEQSATTDGEQPVRAVRVQRIRLDGDRDGTEPARPH
jgi:hypothetical protein